MTARARNVSSLVIVLGAVLTLLNLVELVFLDGGWPQVVGAAIGVALVVVGVARLRGWEGVRR